MEHSKQTNETLILLRQLSKELENASKEKLSTNDITTDRLLWEIFHKIFSILVTFRNCLLSKDSLTTHLVARYTYELLIVFAYIFLDKSMIQKRVEQFITFNQFRDTRRMWTDKTLTQMAGTPKIRHIVRSRDNLKLKTYAKRLSFAN